MTETSDRYRKLAAGFTARVEAVPDDRWSDPAPCEGWTARDVVRHVVDVQGIFLGYGGQEVGPSPSVDEDPAGAWAVARDAVQSALDDPAVADGTFEGPMGKTTLAQMIDSICCSDLLLHGWDLARATGGDEGMDDAEAARVHQFLAGLGDGMRSPGAFGPEVQAPPDADGRARLLAFAGRQP
jgi:uncharacterized protein (TIGR03086 family)